ncbi:hypothetical protein, partial [Pseudoruminococcus massiliensis]|uniref:hypothetical protein n=1 Tax=Pseudoruminococcus massiliensis TaxID=2086583 RepID=UPI00307BD507
YLANVEVLLAKPILRLGGRRLAASSETFNFLGAVRISLVNSSTAVKSLSRQCRGFACKTDSASWGRRLAAKV